MRRAARTAAVVATLAVGLAINPAAASARQTEPVQVTRYRMVDGPRWMPRAIIVRCGGWAEDTAARLVLVRFGGGKPPVYRCLSGAEV